MTHEVVIVDAIRTAFTRAHKGSFRNTRPDTLGAEVIKAIMERNPGVDPAEIEDVVMGCAMPEAEQGMNVARISSLMAGLPASVPGMTVNRFCSSGVQTIAIAADRIANGGIDAALAGGTETMSLIPMGGNKPSANPQLMVDYPETYTPMGTTAENVAARFEVSREDQDAFAAESQRRAIEAWEKNLFADEIVPVETVVYGDGGAQEITVTRDECPRPGTTVDKLAKLRPAFNPKGTVTAGNASPLTDGASVALVTSKEFAEAHDLEPLGYFRTYAVAGVDPDIMGTGPVPAVRKLLEKANLTVEDIDVVELNEAFASQALYCIRELGLDPAKVNPNGGAIALGHPLGTTGARLVATALRQLKRTGGRYAIVTMCIGGGMGFAALLEAA
ncbi:MAG: acetyl-CoA C-acyltransferase [Myxococcales bacterium]|nr:acetyl-CoA C-acyltransferase [Myxococcales bacterium]